MWLEHQNSPGHLRKNVNNNVSGLSYCFLFWGWPLPRVHFEPPTPTLINSKGSGDT